METTIESPETWTSTLRNIFEACETPEELLKAASHLVTYQNCKGVWDYSVPLFRSCMTELWKEHRQHKVVVVDISGLFHACWFVAGANAEHVLKMLRNAYSATMDKSSIFLCAIDHGRGKRDISEDWKSTREERPPEFYTMCSEVKATLRSKGVNLQEYDNTEADDVIASVAFRCQLLDIPCIIVTEDRDMFQMLGKDTVIYSPRKKEYRNSDWLLATQGVRPSQVVDMLAIEGGKNDLPGAAQCGPKTARELLEAYIDVPGIMDHISNLTPAKRKGMKEFYEKHYWTVRGLLTLRRDVAVWWSPKKT